MSRADAERLLCREEFLASRPAASIDVRDEVVAHAISQDDELSRLVTYWTPERIRAARMAEHRRET